jgi:hypothetical protein
MIRELVFFNMPFKHRNYTTELRSSQSLFKKNSPCPPWPGIALATMAVCSVVKGIWGFSMSLKILDLFAVPILESPL